MDDGDQQEIRETEMQPRQLENMNSIRNNTTAKNKNALEPNNILHILHLYMNQITASCRIARTSFFYI